MHAQNIMLQQCTKFQPQTRPQYAWRPDGLVAKQTFWLACSILTKPRQLHTSFSLPVEQLPSCRHMKLPSCCKSSSWQKGSFLTGSCSKEQKHSTRGSRVIPQHSTNLAQTRLTSEIGRDRVLSGWYDRAMRLPHLLRLHMLACWQTERSTD